MDVVDDVVLVDDACHDSNVEVAEKLGIRHTIIHDINKGYGGNQKSCYQKALDLCSGLIEQDTLMRDNNRPALRCSKWVRNAVTNHIVRNLERKL